MIELDKIYNEDCTEVHVETRTRTASLETAAAQQIREVRMMEFRIQFLLEGEWKVVSPSFIEGKWRNGSSTIEDYNLTKCIITNLRKEHPDCKYRIVGREIMPWCEIKEDDVKYE